MKLATIPLLLLLAGIASAQTTTINPGVCIHVQNCVLSDSQGDTVWADIQWNATTGSYQGFLEFGKYPNQQEYTTLVAYPVQNPVDPNPNDSNPILFSCEFQGPDGTTYTEVLKGYSRYGCSGGRGGGCRTVYVITSGSLTVE